MSAVIRADGVWFGGGVFGSGNRVRSIKNHPVDKFAQMEDLLPTPTAYRTASGAPGRNYWQQRADYDIKVIPDSPSTSAWCVSYFKVS